MIREPIGMLRPVEPVGVAGAVPVLVLVADDRRDRGELGDAQQDPLAGDRVLGHDRPLLGGRAGRRLCRISFGMASLPTSCSSARMGDPLDLLGGQPEDHRDAARRGGRPRRSARACSCRAPRSRRRAPARRRASRARRAASRARARRRRWRRRRGPCRCAWRAAARGRRARAGRRRPAASCQAATPIEQAPASCSRAPGHPRSDRVADALGDARRDVLVACRAAAARTRRRRSGRPGRRGAARRCSAAGDAAQQLVAGLVAARVVDALEVVEVEDHAGERRAVARARGRSPRARGPASRRG